MFAANATAQQQGGYRYWRLQDTTDANVSISEWRITTADASITSLMGKTITNLGGAFFEPTYGITFLNDGTAEVVNGTNIANNTSGNLDVYVDLGSAKQVIAYQLAPQGSAPSYIYNTPSNFVVKASNDASTWTTVATFTGITGGYPAWSPGTYRTFSW